MIAFSICVPNASDVSCWKPEARLGRALSVLPSLCSLGQTSAGFTTIYFFRGTHVNAKSVIWYGETALLQHCLSRFHGHGVHVLKVCTVCPRLLRHPRPTRMRTYVSHPQCYSAGVR